MYPGRMRVGRKIKEYAGTKTLLSQLGSGSLSCMGGGKGGEDSQKNERLEVIEGREYGRPRAKRAALCERSTSRKKSRRGGCGELREGLS